MAGGRKKRMKGFGTWLLTKLVWVLILLSGTFTVCAAFFVRFSHGEVPMKYVYVMLGITIGLSVVWRILSLIEKRMARKLLNDKAAAIVLAARMAENEIKESAADSEATEEIDKEEEKE